MTNEKMKIIMTDLAAGHISKKEAEYLIEEEKARQNKPVPEIQGNPEKDHTRKRKLNVRRLKII